MGKRKRQQTRGTASVLEDADPPSDVSRQPVSLPGFMTAVRLPATVQQHQALFLKSMEPMLKDAEKILDLEAYHTIGGRRYFHIKGAMARFQTEYAQSMPEKIPGLPKDDPNERMTTRWMGNLLQAGESLGELVIASKVLERDNPPLWETQRARMQESRAFLEQYVGACIAVIQSNYDKDINDEFYSQHDALLDMFRQYDVHKEVAKESKITAFIASHQPPALRARLNTLIERLGLERHVLHGNELYLPADCVPTVRSMAERVSLAADEAAGIVRNGRWYLSETAILNIDGEKTDRGKEIVGGLLRVTDAINELRKNYVESINAAITQNGESPLGHALFNDFSAFAGSYGELCLFDRIDGGAYRDVSKAMEDVLVYHVAAYNAFFDKRVELALQLQAELGHDASWVRQEYECAKLLLLNAAQDRDLKKERPLRKLSLDAPWSAVPGDCAGLPPVKEDELLAGVDRGRLGRYRGSIDN